MKKLDEVIAESKIRGEEHLVFKDVTTLLVSAGARVVPQVEKPGTGELVSFRVFSEIGSREAELMVRVDGARGSYACWRLQEVGGKCMRMLGTFDALGA